jgi:hypothetical protein
MNGDTTLYAVWEAAKPIQLGVPQAFVADNPIYLHMYEFTPSLTGYYRVFTTQAKAGTIVELWNTGASSRTSYAQSTTGDSSVVWNLTAGTTYYIAVRFYDNLNETGSFMANIIRDRYTITFDANGGSGAPSAQTKTAGTDLTLSTTKPTLSGYTFLDWSTSSSATASQYVSGDKYTAEADVTFYAVWTNKTTYTVTYNANSGSNAPAAQLKVQGTTLVLSTGIPTRTYYRFLGWATTSTATTAVYQPGGSFTIDTITTLYAVWQAVPTYTVTYNANGGSSAPSAQTKYDGITLALSATLPVRVGFSFLGWAESASATTSAYLPGESYVKNQNTTLYALWGSAPLELVLNTIYTVDITKAGTVAYYTFTPSTDGRYILTSSDNTQDPAAELYSSAGAKLAFDDDGGSGSNFQLCYVLRAGQTYTYKVYLYGTSVVGSFK